jgi:hypothetical protein
MNQPTQTFELEVSLEDSSYVYRLVIDSHGDPPQARIVSESVKLNHKPIFEFESGSVRLFNDRFEIKVDYPSDTRRSAFANITDTKDNRKLLRFKEWFGNLLCFRINPFRMAARAESEDLYPWFDLSNFAAWYRHLWQSSPGDNERLWESLRAALDGFDILRLDRAGKDIRSLISQFKTLDGRTVELELNKLSDGQRCLIGLYTIVHFVLSKGHTVILDEPDNFIALREIQPWLNSVSDAIDENSGQVLIISHHPELMNQCAPDFGVRFLRDGMGPVRVKEFSGEGYSSLLPSEIVARGWENE